MKKILALLLAAAAALSVAAAGLSAAAAETENTVEAADGSKIDFAFDMGVLTLDENSDRLLDDDVTRINLLIAVYRLMNYDDVDTVPAATKQYYSDIGLYHYGAGYAQAMTESGFVKGRGDGTYGADSIATLNEAILILLRSAGYENYFDMVGETPYRTADELGLLKSISAGPDDNLTRRELAILIYNLMFVKTYEMTPSGAEINYAAGGEYIRDVLDLDYTTGILDGINGISLYSSIADDRASVNGRTYTLGKKFPDSLLGFNVLLVYDPDADEALSVIKDERNTSVTIESGMIESYSDYTYYYYRSEGSSSTARYTLDMTFDAVYNGSPLFDTEYMVPEYGSVTLTDNDNDGKYEVAVINDYESFIAESYSSAENMITMKNRDDIGANIKIDLDGYTSCKITDDGGSEFAVTNIPQGASLLVKRAIDGARIEITVCIDTVEGTINSVAYDGDTAVVTIGDTEYETVPGYYIYGWTLTSGIETEAYLDANGNIAGFEKLGETSDGWRYAYIENVYIGDDGETLGLKLFTDGGAFQSIECIPNVTIDGEKISDPQTAVDKIYIVYDNFEDIDITGYTSEAHTKRVVRYYTNSDGKVSSIDTPVVHSLYDLSVPADYSTNNCLMLRSKGYIYWKSGMRMFKAVTAAHMDVQGDVSGSDSMRIFLLPEDMNSASDKDYSVTTLGQNSFAEAYYYASAYNTVVDSTQCEVMAVRNKLGNTTKKMMVIDKTGEMVGSDGDIVTSISGYVGGSYQTLPVEESAFALTSELKKGDIVFYNYTNNTMIINELGYSADKEGYLNDADAYHPDDGGTHFNIPYRILKAKVTRVVDNIMQVTPANQAVELMMLPSTVIIYDSETGEVTPGNIYDVRTEQSYGGDADTVFISTRNGTIDEMIAIR